MKIKRILLIALILALPVFAFYLAQNQDILVLIKEEVKQPKVLLAFLVSSLILLSAHMIRAYKTKMLTDSIKHTSLLTHSRALFIGYLFNVLLPLRLGEIIRAFVLGKGIRMSATFMFGLVLLDRAIDGFILGLLTLFILWMTPYFDAAEVRSITFVAALTLMLVSFIVLALLLIIRRQPVWLLKFWHSFTALFNNSLRDSLRFKFWSLIYGLERVIILKRLKRYLLLSIAMWALYIVAVFPIASIFITNPTAGSLTATSTVSYLGVSAPNEPSHIGSYGKFVQPYVDAFANADALRLALIFTWLLQIIPAFIVGLAFVLRTKETIKRPVASKDLQAIDDKLLRDVDITHDLGSFLDAFFTNNSLSRIMHRLEVDKDSKLIHYFKGGSNAVTALVYENDSFLVRKITPIQYRYKLKSQYDWLKDKEKLDRVVNVLSEETTDSYYKIDLEYNQEFIPLFDYIHSMPATKSKKILSEVFAYLNKDIYKPEAQKYRPKDLSAYINDRCLSKIRQAAEVNDEIRSLLTYNELVINGEKYKNIPQIINQIKKDKSISTLLATYRRCSIHGDTTIDNILADKSTNKFLLIDPTDNENEISGPVFDFGRMTQSLRYGYEFLNRDDQQVSVFENQVDFEYSISKNYAQLAKHLENLQDKYLTPEEQKAVLFHSALLYSRMLTHRVVINPLNAAKYYAISVIAFNDFIRQVKS
jgi:hypothetical protein